MALRQLLLIEPKLLVIGAIVLLSAFVLALVLDGGTASAGCEYFATADGWDSICDRSMGWSSGLLNQISYAWGFYFG